MSRQEEGRTRTPKSSSTDGGAGTEGGLRIPGAPLLAALVILGVILACLGVAAHQRSEVAKKAAAAAAATTAPGGPAQPTAPAEKPATREQEPSAPITN